MKTSRLLTWIIAISFLCMPALSHAYTSIHGDFGSGSTNNGSVGIQYPGYMVSGSSVTNFRAFVPPGTTRISLQITVQNYSNLYTAAQMGTPPSGYSGPPAYDPGTGSSLAQLESGNCFATTIGGGINVANDAWSSPLSVSRSGWLYVDIVGGNNVYWIKYQVYFDVSAYNAWYSTINWATNVEGAGTGTSTGTSGTATSGTGSTDPIFGSPTTGNTGTSTTGTTSSITDPLTCMFSGGVWENGQCRIINSSTSTTTTDPVLQIAVNANQIRQFAQKEITASEVGNRSAVVIKPTLQLTNLPSGNYELYAGVMKSDGLYLCDKDIASQTVFVKWLGERLRVIDKRSLSGNASVEFNIFDALKLSNTPQYYAGHGLHFLIAIAPEGSSEVQSFLNNFYGAELWFSPSIH